ncbi:MAG: type II toxin-antitoxin system VapC family toxin [Parvibaculaceae bacterium]
MISVVDANVAIRWFVDLPHKSQARAIVESGQTLLAPDLLVAEVANTLWRYVKVGDCELEHAAASVAQLPAFFEEIVFAMDLSVEALRMAKSLDHSVYDCLYAVLAVERQAMFVTDDRRFAEKLRVSRRLPNVTLLEEIVVR